MASRHLDVIVHATPEAVFDVARDPANLPRWAAGLATGEVVSAEDGTLAVDSPMGRVTVVFTPRNDLGVLDHEVTLPSGERVHNPLRVLPHPDGAEVVFTLRQGDATDEAFAQDAALVQADLLRLKTLVEG
jgi:uncharacterized protein YndB with AHSA1/START domain